MRGGAEAAGNKRRMERSIYYIGSGIFYPWGVSITAPSAGSDITCCNSAGGIIDLSAGSRHQHHHTGAPTGLDSALFLQIDTSCLILRALTSQPLYIIHTCAHTHTQSQEGSRAAVEPHFLPETVKFSLKCCTFRQEALLLCGGLHRVLTSTPSSPVG